MADEWNVAPLGELYEFSSGLSKPSSAFGAGYPFLSFKDVFYNIFVPKRLTELVQSTEQERERCAVRRGDVFLTRTSETMDELGMSCVSLRDIHGATFNGFTKRLRPKDSRRIVPEYVGYYFRSPGFRQAVTAMSSMSTRASLNNEMLARLSITLPSFEEQTAIGQILGSLDKKIELNRRMNELLEAMAQALFKSWFVDFDPVRAKAEGRDHGVSGRLVDLFPDSFVDSDLGSVPKGWQIRSLYEIAQYVNGAAYKAFEPNEDRQGLAIIKIAELKAGVTAKTKFSSVSMPEKYRISRGDILFSWSGNPDTSIDTFVWAHEQAWLNQHIFRVMPNRARDRSLVLSILKHLKPTFAEIARNKQTTGLGHVTAADMKRLQVIWPDDHILEAFNRIAGPLHARIHLLDLETQTLARQRDALLPKLISGEIRVKDAEGLVEHGSIA